MALLQTTTIGSLGRLTKDLNESIDRALDLQLQHRVDILSDGEQRADMISYFAESLEGLAVEGNACIVAGKISPKGSPAQFSKIRDLDYIRSKYPYLKVKVALTGPTTLGMTCGSRKIKGHYSNIADSRMYEDIAVALAPIAKAVTDRGAYLQIDEPFLSQGYKDLGDRVKLLDYVTEGLPKNRVSVHVCGFIGGYGVLDHLLKLENVSTLSFAFSGRLEQGNIDHVSKKAFVEAGKMLGAGCIAVTPMTEKDVDPPEKVASKLDEIASRVGRETIRYAHPDCGMRATNKSLVPIILKNMRAGVDLFG